MTSKKALEQLIASQQNRLASLEEVLGATWYDALEEHDVYYSRSGELQTLLHRIKENQLTLYRLLDYLNLEETTYPEKTVIEPAKKKKS